ncbi:MAG: M15 family metallopeptidase [Clostridia bacterium]|nr:M15 family metallopeptidase [Clostridia bacterium]MDD4047954.1 M15 family metallopeptidase [Clostridia bacterium]
MKNVRKRKRNRVTTIAFTTIILLCIISAISMINNCGDIPHNQIYHDNKAETNSSYSSNNNASYNNSSNVENNDWKLILVNGWSYIPKNYTVTLKTLKNDFQVDERIYPDLQEMFDAARNDGSYPLIYSAYRTTEKQQKLFTNKINAYIAEGYSKKEANELAKTWVAVPGTSEHQLGLAIDINAEKDKCTNEEVYVWLNTNGYKYGFIMRYPADKAQITGVNYEPWHYRYVGKEAAKKIYEQGICLEEYLDARK